MEDDNSILPPPKRTPWNKGKLIGAKPPLLARHVCSIRTKLQIERRARELAMFNLAIDSKLRGCDVVAMKVEGVAPVGQRGLLAAGGPLRSGSVADYDRVAIAILGVLRCPRAARRATPQRCNLHFEGRRQV